MKKLCKGIFTILLLLVIGITSLFFGKGYLEYLNLQRTKTVDQVVQEVQSSGYYVTYDNLSTDLLRATVAIEDRRFYDHDGVDYIGLVRAMVSQFDSDFLKSGGSTITQQLAKNLYGMFDASWDRKSCEFFIAKYLEKHYSKNEILALYVNIINYGNGYTGIYQASVGYFGVIPMDLNVGQCTLLAGIPQSPNNYELVNHFENAKQKQYAVLKAMVECGYISQSEIATIYAMAV